MTHEDQTNPGGARFDLDERTAVFGERIIGFARAIKTDVVTGPLISQLIRAATSIGANYDEADEATTKKDFRYRIGISKKEARETKRWLRMIATAVPDHREAARDLWKEANELHLIFATIYRNSADKG